jgi:hypothetical protein|eukprot:Tamp_15368.p1 GENE.Tamp_15368~~Tamp_15368.p1  ORF type:complete len:447 (+),score=16.32 Tamp_15368:56-1396(+)
MKNIQKKWYQSISTDFTLLWVYSLFGISSTIPRRCINGIKHIYFFNQSMKNLKYMPFNEKIRQIILWKKEAQKNKDKTFNTRIPSYSMEELILEKFPTFKEALKEFLGFFPMFFFIFYKNLLTYRKYMFLNPVLSFITRFQFFLTGYVKLKRIIIIENILKLKLVIKGKKFDIIIPKKQNDFKISEERKTVKILINFQIQLASNVLSKIFSLQKHKILSKSYYYINRTYENWFINPLRYYKVKEKSSVISYHNCIKHLNKTIFFRNKIGLFKENLNQLWNFSKNFLKNTLGNSYQNKFFYISTDISNFCFQIVTTMLQFSSCPNQNHGDLSYFYSKNFYNKNSLLTGSLFLNFLIDCVNIGINLPTLPYLNPFRKINRKFSLKRFSRNKKKLIFRNSRSFKNLYFDLDEISFSNTQYSIFTNKKNRFNPFDVNIYKGFLLDLCFMT